MSKEPGAIHDWEIVPPEVAFVRGMVHGDFDLSELSFGTYLLQLSRGETLYKAIPVFPSRAFRHSAIYIRADAGIDRPEDLIGRNIGVPEWQLTANLWARGILSDEYGVAVEKVNWHLGDTDEVGRTDKVSVILPPRISATPIAPDETLWSLMTQGKLDAIIAPRAPRAFVEADPRVRRLFTDVKTVEQAYFQKTGIFPIMHLLGIRNDVLADHPDLASKLFDGFERARRHAHQELNQVAYFYVMLPWLIDHLAETKRVMGDDYWPYGTAANQTVVETMCRYACEQGLTDRQMHLEELFVPI